MLNPKSLEKGGVLPINNSTIRFAVGNPIDLTSNSWKIWEKNGSIYIACRDNFSQAKVSLHPNCYRMAFTSESKLLMKDSSRKWDEWTIENEQIDKVKIIFRIFFAKRDLAIPPEVRKGKKWQNLIFIEPPSNGKLITLSFFLLNEDFRLEHESEPSFDLATYEINKNQYLKVIVHGETFGNIIKEIDTAKEKAIKQVNQASINLPKSSYAYFLGRLSDNSRYLVGTPIKIDNIVY
jgi:hypothetical protein